MNTPASFFKSFSVIITLIILLYSVSTLNSGCAQIGSISGGVKDTLAPVLVKASPPQNTVNFKGNHIQFTFDEYIEVKDVSTNVIVSPYQNSTPLITFNRKTINIKFRDTLLPNTTYSINFGNSIRDFNESNPLSGLTYVFSTGSKIDELSISGKVLLAETSKADSTIEVLIYKDATDSSVHTRKPDYLVRTNGAGEFTVNNLPPDSYKVYALRDNDGNKRYNSNREVFGFLNNDVFPENVVAPILIYAYREVPLEVVKPSLPKIEKVFKISSNLENKKADILSPLILSFSRRVANYDSVEIKLIDSLNNDVALGKYDWDSTLTNVTLSPKWQAGMAYSLIIPDSVYRDPTGKLLKGDTLKFSAKSLSDYGRIVLRFKNLDPSKNPVLQLFQGDKMVAYGPIKNSEWSNNIIPPATYEIRILFDTNGNGIWDAGNFNLKKQPEIGITIPQTIAVKADWDNERDIIL